MVLLRAFLLARTEVGRQTPEHGLKITAFLRHADKSPSRWFLFRRIRIHNNHHQHFLAYVSPPPSSLLPPSLEAAERTHNKATHPHVLPSGYWYSGATRIGSKRALLIKLRNGLTPECKQTFAVHAPSAYTHNSTSIFIPMGRPEGPCLTQNPRIRPLRKRQIVLVRRYHHCQPPVCG
jgi:hypothetical protein